MIRFHTLGALDLRDSNGQEILSVIAQPKRLALLAYLAASSSGRFHRRDTLVGIFWPESDQRHARDSLRQAVHYLRCSLGEGVVIGRGGEELGIDAAALWCDANAFEQALDAGENGRALDLYGGDLLAGFFLSDVPKFERWLESERGRLRGRAVEAAWAFAEECEAAGNRTAAVQCARRARDLCPDDEDSLRRLIALLNRLGDRASAVRVYEDFAARLAEECGVEPSAQTRALVAEARPADGPGTASTWPVDADPRPVPVRSLTVMSSLARPDEEATPGDDAGRRKGSAAGLRFRQMALAVAAGLLLLVTAGAGIVFSVTAWSPADSSRVVIVPFENRTGELSLDPLGRWAADGIAHSLTRMSRVRVVDAAVGLPGSSSRDPNGSHLRSHLAESEPGLIISGAYYRHGDSIQFQVQITDGDGGAVAPTLEPLSGSLEQTQVAVRELSERITGALAAHLDPRIRAVNAHGSRPPSYEAYQVWIDGLQTYGERDYAGAREHLLYAASLDSSFITPLIWAAAASEHLGQNARADSLLQIANARRSQLLPFDRHLLDRWRARLGGDRAGEYRAARRMLEVAPASELALYLVGATALAINHPGETLEVLRRIDIERSAADWDSYGTRLTHAYHLLGDYRRELGEAQRARERRPGVLRAISNEVRALAALGRADEVLQLLDRALTLSPNSEETPASVARSAAEELRAHGHVEASSQALTRALAWYRTRPPEERATEAYRYGVARTLYRAGRWAEAEALFRVLAELSPEKVDYLGYLGVIAAREGETREAHRISRGLLQMRSPNLRGSNTFWRARIAALAGQEGESIALLSASFAQGQPYGLAVHAETDFEPLRDRPAFQELLQPRR